MQEEQGVEIGGDIKGAGNLIKIIFLAKAELHVEKQQEMSDVDEMEKKLFELKNL
jgi:hypothetical protein